MAIRLKSATQPSAAASPESCAMPSGPVSCFGDVSRVSRPTSVRKMSPPNS